MDKAATILGHVERKLAELEIEPEEGRIYSRAYHHVEEALDRLSAARERLIALWHKAERLTRTVSEEGF